jgi:hypothetical protein
MAVSPPSVHDECRLDETFDGGVDRCPRGRLSTLVMGYLDVVEPRRLPRMRTFAATLSLSALTLALAASGGARTQATVQLTGTVGPGFTITLKNRTKIVKTLAPAKYTFVINDKSNIHNFHLTGPGVNRKTTVAGTGTTHWTITLRAGTYNYVCDPHKSSMHGRFIVRAP